ncbi:MAG: class II aldolase/adducin family protein [Chloroflexi bacterium]|nr:class II aldolase/adducin family protein [Chloroflexota bacterium]MBU1746647.1 class II aldolase/adducin family protein [Chloroflexota bacterium]
MSTYRQRQTEGALRDEIVRVCRLLHEHGWVPATDGNVSARLAPDRILVTPNGLSKGFVTAEDLVVVDMAGRPQPSPLYGSNRRRPTSELPLHLEVYRRRPDANAVVHAHPPTSIALSIAGIPIARCMLPEVLVNLGTIPTTEYAMPGSPEGPGVMGHLVERHDALVLQRHGSVTVGRDLMDAYLKTEKVEHAAEVTFLVAQLGSPAPLPPQEAAKLIAVRRLRSQMSPAEEAELCVACGLCEPTTGLPGDDALVAEVTRRVLASLPTSRNTQ